MKILATVGAKAAPIAMPVVCRNLKPAISKRIEL